MRWLPVLLLTGCAGTSVDGRIDGEGVSMKDAFFVVDEGVFDGDDRVRVFVAGVSDFCARRANWLAELEDTETAADEAAAWSEHMPGEFWLAMLDLRVAAGTEPTGTFTGIAHDDILQEAGQVEGAITHYLKPLDEAYWDSTGILDDYSRQYLTEGGALEVDRYDGERFRGSFQTETQDWDERQTGAITIGFDARRCASIESL